MCNKWPFTLTKALFFKACHCLNQGWTVSLIVFKDFSCSLCRSCQESNVTMCITWHVTCDMCIHQRLTTSTCVWTGAPCRPFRHSTDNYRCTWLWLNHNKARRSFGAEHYLTCTGHFSSNSLHCTSLHHGPDPKMEIQRTKRSITREQAAQLSARCWPQLTSFTKSPGWIWVATWMIFKPLECASPVLLHHAYGTLLCPLSF